MEEITDISEVHTVIGKVIECKKCGTVINYFEGSTEDCPFCHRPLRKYGQKIVSSALADLLSEA